MNRLSILFTAFVSALVVVCAGCGSKSRGVSSKTGWAYNDANNGGFTVAPDVKPGAGPGLIAIEGGTFVMGGSLDQDLTYEYDNKRKRVTVASFYMDETEVANIDWREYLHWIRQNFPDDREYYYRALPDTLVWRRPLSYNEPYVQNYLRHPAYQNYPVVGVSWEQAREYAVWRTDRVNEKTLRDKGYLADYNTSLAQGTPPFNTEMYLNGQYRVEGVDGQNLPEASSVSGTLAGNAKRTIGREDGILQEYYRLPTEAEWEYAALALAGNTSDENIAESKIYPWNGMGVRSTAKKTEGLMMANFKRGRGDNMGTGGHLNDKADITAPVKSYMANDFGLYNMAGNVNEWVEDTYRKLSYEHFDDFNPFRGNQFMNKRLEDAVKGTYAKDSHGRPIMEPAPSRRKQTWEELNGLSDSLTEERVQRRPFSSDMRGYKDTIDQSLYGEATLVNNRSKVYKGGSWNDRAYWLNPATRRFMQQDESSAEVGFRCAMNMVGSAEVISRYKSARKNRRPGAQRER